MLPLHRPAKREDLGRFRDQLSGPPNAMATRKRSNKSRHQIIRGNPGRVQTQSSGSSSHSRDGLDEIVAAINVLVCATPDPQDLPESTESDEVVCTEQLELSKDEVQQEKRTTEDLSSQLELSKQMTEDLRSRFELSTDELTKSEATIQQLLCPLNTSAADVIRESRRIPVGLRSTAGRIDFEDGGVLDEIVAAINVLACTAGNEQDLLESTESGEVICTEREAKLLVALKSIALELTQLNQKHRVRGPSVSLAAGSSGSTPDPITSSALESASRQTEEITARLSGRSARPSDQPLEADP